MHIPQWRGVGRFALFGVVWLMCAHQVSAQWVKVPVSTTPRTASGAPNLSAPTPQAADGHPDLSGVWARAMGRGVSVPNPAGATPIPMTPSAQAIFTARRENGGKDMPSGRCLPHGLTKAPSVPEPFKIIQTPALTVILHEELNNYRQIFLEGHAPTPVGQAWFGHSVGRWEDDVFVVRTDGFVDDMWLDVVGHPATAQLRIIERWRRSDFGHLESQITVEDPGSYTAPWSFQLRFNLMADGELIENICESERDSLHLVGK